MKETRRQSTVFNNRSKTDLFREIGKCGVGDDTGIEFGQKLPLFSRFIPCIPRRNDENVSATWESVNDHLLTYQI